MGGLEQREISGSSSYLARRKTWIWSHCRAKGGCPAADKSLPVTRRPDRTSPPAEGAPPSQQGALFASPPRTSFHPPQQGAERCDKRSDLIGGEDPGGAERG